MSAPSWPDDHRPEPVIAWKSDLTKSMIDELISEAERLANDRGFSPLPAT